MPGWLALPYRQLYPSVMPSRRIHGSTGPSRLQPLSCRVRMPAIELHTVSLPRRTGELRAIAQ